MILIKKKVPKKSLKTNRDYHVIKSTMKDNKIATQNLEKLLQTLVKTLNLHQMCNKNLNKKEAGKNKIRMKMENTILKF